MFVLKKMKKMQRSAPILCIPVWFYLEQARQCAAQVSSYPV